VSGCPETLGTSFHNTDNHRRIIVDIWTRKANALSIDAVDIDLDNGDTWPSDVWRAFEKASQARTAKLVAENNGRRDTGNALKHPSVEYQSELRRMGLAPIVETHHGIDEVLTPGERIAEHTGDVSWADTPGPHIGPKVSGVENLQSRPVGGWFGPAAIAKYGKDHGKRP
jgi:hypothetical protein